MALLAKIERGARVSNSRTASRRKLSLVARGVTAAQEFATVVIHDLSETGVLIETKVQLATGEPLEIDIQEAGTVAATVVWSSGQFFGCQFERRLPKAAVSASILRNAARPPAMAIANAPDSNEVGLPAEDVGKWPVAVRLWVLVTLGASAWAVLGVIAWATLMSGAIA
jgi:hypothetical protein